MRRYTPRDWFVLALIGLAILYALEPRILQQPFRLEQTLYFLGLKLIVIAVSITVHEFGHAFVAYKLGDPTPKDEGRVSLNPLRHLDPVGTFMILFAPIGWGKPVRWNPGNIDKTNIRVALIAVSLAGIVMNLLLAFVLEVVLESSPDLSQSARQILLTMQVINISLATFNILPIPPLDGYNFWLGVLPPSLSHVLYPLNQYGFLILIGLVMLPILGGPNLLSVLFDPVSDFFTRLVRGGF
jgi:Zn-dependent protease